MSKLNNAAQERSEAETLKGKVVAITGAASGIGKATAHLLASQGVMLSLADADAVNLGLVEQMILQSQPTASVLSTVVDIRKQEPCTQWIQATVKHFGQPIAGAANLAGVFGGSIGQERGAIRNVADTEYDFVMDVNVRGTFNCIRAELPHMQQGVRGRGGGSIVNAASMAGIVGVENNGPYVASKHAIIGLTRTVAKEEGPKAIRVNAIAPGIVATPMIQQIEAAAGTTDLFGTGDPGALGRKGDAEEVARLVVFLLGPESSFISGAVIPIDGGWMC